MEIYMSQPLNGVAEIGDYVEQDEEIATIETDKVHWGLTLSGNTG